MSDSSKTIVLITGANQGIGFATARALACDHGFHVLLGSRNHERGQEAASQLQSEGLSVEPLLIDLASDESIKAAVEEVAQKYGYIDVLINNAGVSLDYKVTDMRTLYQQTFNTNVAGSACVTESFIPLLSQSRNSPPRIVFISSTLGSLSDRTNPHSQWSHVPLEAYRASKAALNMICLGFSARLGEEGWKVNTVCPGGVATAINGGIGKPVEECLEAIIKIATLGKDGETGTFTDEKGVVGW